MPSSDNRDLSHFLGGVETAPVEAAVLERVRDLDRLELVAYLHFLLQFAPRHPPSRELPERHEPFSL